MVVNRMCIAGVGCGLRFDEAIDRVRYRRLGIIANQVARLGKDFSF